MNNVVRLRDYRTTAFCVDRCPSDQDSVKLDQVLAAIGAAETCGFDATREALVDILKGMVREAPAIS